MSTIEFSMQFHFPSFVLGMIFAFIVVVIVLIILTYKDN